MAKKRELLAELTREQLVSLAETYEIVIDRAWAKPELVEALASSRRLKTEGLVDLKAQISRLGSVAGAVFGRRQGYFEETAIAAFDEVDSIGDTLSLAIAVQEVVDPGFTAKLTAQLEHLRGSKIATETSAPQHIWTQLSGRQKGAYGTAKSLSYQIPKFVAEAVAASKDTDVLKDLSKHKSLGLPPRIAYYLEQAYRAYIAQCFDSSIVMLARAIEHVLKKRLAEKAVEVPPKATLGKLVELHRQHIGNDHSLEKVLEVSNMDRIVSAHDIPPYDKQMDKKDADHAWTAIEIVFRELLP